MTEKKSGRTEGRQFGSFLADVASGRLPEITIRTPEEDEQISRNAFALTRHERLKAKVAALEAEVAALKRANNSARKCPLWTYIREAKRKYPLKVSDHAFIARCVDALLEKAKKELRHTCPKSWKEVRDLPRLLSEGLQHPKLKKRIRVFISKVPVS